MRKRAKHGLTPRERQIMDVLYKVGRASASEIHAALPDPPTYTAVRTHLTILQEKGHITFEKDKARYIYEPVVPREEMAKSALDGVLNTFFGGSIERVVATLIGKDESDLNEDEMARLRELIEQAKQEGR